jgi:hypothetical protein
MNDKPKSLLSFLYNVMYDEDTKRAFHENEGDAARRFGLSDDVVNLLVTIGQTETGTEGDRKVWDALLQRLGDELHDNRTIFW